MCGCNKCNSNPCDECSPQPCKCHPCYKTLIGNCKTPCDGTDAKPIEDCMVNSYCDDGCVEFLSAKCIQFNDGQTLEDKWDNLIAILADIKSCVSAIGGDVIIRGCTDPTSTNYNPLANVDDGTCLYNCPTSGTFNTAISNKVCNTNINLNQFLNGASMGGNWYIGGCGNTNVSNSTWSINGSTLTQISTSVGVHTFNYVVSSDNCTSECTEITLEVCDKGTIGNSSNFTLPLNSTQTVNLHDYITGEDLGGTWYLQGQVVNSITIPDTSLVGNWVYTYKINEDCCGGTSADVGFTVTDLNCADITSGSLTIQKGDDTAYNLNDYLTGYIPNGTWTLNNTVASNMQNFSAMNAGTYLYTYSVTVSGCPEVTATVTVVIEGCINAGEGQTGTVCVDGPNTSIDLMTLLVGAESGGNLGDTSQGGITLCEDFPNVGHIHSGAVSNVNVNIPQIVTFNGSAPGTYFYSYGTDCDCTTITINAVTCDFTFNGYTIVDSNRNPITCCQDNYYVDLDITGSVTDISVGLSSYGTDTLIGPFTCNDIIVDITNGVKTENINVTSLNECTYMEVCIEDFSSNHPITGVLIPLWKYSINIENPFQSGEYNGETITVAPTATITDANGNPVTYTSNTASTFISWDDTVPNNLGSIVNFQVTTTGGTYTVQETITYGTDITLDENGSGGTPNECDRDIDITIIKS